MRMIFILLVVSIALFGCTSNTPAEAGAQVQAAPQPPAETSGAPGTEPASEAAPPPVEGDPAADAPGTGPAGEDAAVPCGYSGRTFAQLAAMGVPLECNVTHTYQGAQIVSRMYMNGTEELRFESSAGLSQCQKTVSVVRGSRIYFSCGEGKMVFPSCDWLREDYTEPGRSSTFDLASLGPDAIACTDWEYDESFFKTPGEVCHLG